MGSKEFDTKVGSKALPKCISYFDMTVYLKLVFYVHSTAGVMLGQTITSATCGNRTHTQR